MYFALQINFQRNKSVRVLAERLSVDPVPFDRVVDMTSVSIKPHIVVHLFRVWTIDCDIVCFWYKLLECIVTVIVCDNRQSWRFRRTKLPCFIPTQHWTISVETIVLAVPRVALAECRYDTYGVQYKQCTSYKTLENVSTANALQLEAGRRRSVRIRFYTSPVASLKSLSLSAAVLEHIYCLYVTLRCDLELWPRDIDVWPLTLNICGLPAVP